MVLFNICFFLFINFFSQGISGSENKYLPESVDVGNITSSNSALCITTWKNTLKISDAGNKKDSLFFGTSVNGTNGIDTCLGEHTIPPVPPLGAFDVRFIIPGDFSKTDIKKDTANEMVWLVRFQPSPSGYPITFTWNNNAFPSSGYFYLKDSVGGSIVNVNMRGQSSYTLTNSEIGLLKIEYTRIKINLKVSPEGFYFPLFNQLSRRDTFSVYLRNIVSPYIIVDSAKGIVDSITFSYVFTFSKTVSSSYYIIVKHLNSVETWSMSGGTNINSNGTIFNYDFTSSLSQAYGNNLQLKSGKYCFYGGDVDQNGFVDLTDLVNVFNKSRDFLSGRYLPTDLNGDSIVDLTDIALCYNNSTNFIRIRRP